MEFIGKIYMDLQYRIYELAQIMSHNYYHNPTCSASIDELVYSDVIHRRYIKEAIDFDPDLETSIKAFTEASIKQAIASYKDDVEEYRMLELSGISMTANPSVTAADMYNILERCMNINYAKYIKPRDKFGLSVEFHVVTTDKPRVSGVVKQSDANNLKEIVLEIFVPQKSFNMLLDTSTEQSAFDYLNSNISGAIIHEFVHMEQLIRSNNIARNDKSYKPVKGSTFDAKMTSRAEIGAYAKQASHEMNTTGKSAILDQFKSIPNDTIGNQMVKKEFLKQYQSQLDRYKNNSKGA